MRRAFVLLLVLASCGSSEDSGSPPSTPATDAADEVIEAGIDATSEGAWETGKEAEPELEPEAGPDSSPDVSPDATIDAPSEETLVEASPDSPPVDAPDGEPCECTSANYEYVVTGVGGPDGIVAKCPPGATLSNVIPAWCDCSQSAFPVPDGWGCYPPNGQPCSTHIRCDGPFCQATGKPCE